MYESNCHTTLEPAILLLSHLHFAQDTPDLSRYKWLRGLFIKYPGQDHRPALADYCQRWQALPAGRKPANLTALLAHLVG